MTILSVNVPLHSIPYAVCVVVAVFGLFESKPSKLKLGIMLACMVILHALALIPYMIQGRQDILWPFATIIYMSATQTFVALGSIRACGIKSGFKVMAASYAAGSLTVFVLILSGVLGS